MRCLFCILCSQFRKQLSCSTWNNPYSSIQLFEMHKPICQGSFCSVGPEVPIVYDFPAPDCPYAKSETLYPMTNDSILSFNHSMTPSCPTFSLKTRSNTKFRLP